MINNMNYIGWLSPDGKLFGCDLYDHSHLSIEILSTYYKIDISKMKVIERDDALFNIGWCRIGFESFIGHGYVIQAKWDFITEEQISFIQNMYFDENVTMTEQTMDDLERYNIIDIDDIVSLKKTKK